MSDFSDNSSELDKYGVWVKKTTSSNEEKEIQPSEEPVVDESFITQSAASDFEIEQDLAEFDIDSLAGTPVVDEPVMDETSVPETTAAESQDDAFTTEAIPEGFTDSFAQEETVVAEETSVPEDELSLDDFSMDSIADDNGPMTFTADPAPAEETTPAETTEEVSLTAVPAL